MTRCSQRSLQATASLSWLCSGLCRQHSCCVWDGSKGKTEEEMWALSCLLGSESSDNPTFSLDRRQCNELHWIIYSHITARNETVWWCCSVCFSTGGNTRFYSLTYNSRKQWYTHPIIPSESRESTMSEPAPSQPCLKWQHLSLLPTGSLESKLTTHWGQQGLHIWNCCPVLLGFCCCWFFFFFPLAHIQSSQHFPVMEQNCCCVGSCSMPSFSSHCAVLKNNNGNASAALNSKYWWRENAEYCSAKGGEKSQSAYQANCLFSAVSPQRLYMLNSVHLTPSQFHWLNRANSLKSLTDL